MEAARAHTGCAEAVVAALAMMAAALAIPLILVAGAARSDSNPETLALDGVSAEALAGIGITLKAPPSDFAPKIGKREIEASRESGASSLGFDLPIREIVLAQVSDKSKAPPIDRVLWVVSLDKTGARMPNLGPGRPGRPNDFPYLYSLVFVDPDTGAFVYSAEAACCAPSPGETPK